MTDIALAATLFGAEDLRLVEAPTGPLTPGMVRVRFGAGGICGSDMHYYRHGRTGDFVVKSPLVLGHEIAGEIVDIAADALGPQDWRPCRSQPITVVPTLREMPGRPSEPMREHLLHGISVKDAAHAGGLCHVFRCHPGPVCQSLGQYTNDRGSAGRAPRCLPSRHQSGRPSGRPKSNCIWGRSYRSPDIIGCSIGRSIGSRDDRCRRRSACLCAAFRR